MSINWVMLHETHGFVRLPGEKPVWKSSPRTSFALTTPRTYPGHNPINIHSGDGTLYLTNQRIVYLPKTATEAFKSFSASLLNLHDTHIVVPWFGPNSWQTLVQPVPGGNISAGHSAVELKLTFKEGGAPDFETNFNRIKERLQQVVDTARESNQRTNQNGGMLNNVSLANVHLDELPSYQASGHDRIAPPEQHAGSGEPISPMALDAGGSSSLSAPDSLTAPTRVLTNQGTNLSQLSTNSQQPPPEAPPGYEETQQQSIQAELERRLAGEQ